LTQNNFIFQKFSQNINLEAMKKWYVAKCIS